jgi:hypothetical protein
MSTVTMVAGTRNVLSFAADDTEYRPDSSGQFKIDERHVATARSHGLIAKGEVPPGRITRTTAADENAALAAENKRLRELLETNGVKIDATGNDAGGGKTGKK